MQPDTMNIYQNLPELRLLLASMFFMLGSSVFYISSLISGNNIYRDLSFQVSFVLTTIVGFMLFAFSPISFITLFPQLFLIPHKTTILLDNTILLNDITHIHELVFDEAFIPFILSSVGAGLVSGSLNLIHIRFLLLRWFRQISGIHYLIYSYNFAWDSFLSGIKKHANIRLISSDKSYIEGELVSFSVKAEPKEIVIHKKGAQDVLVTSFENIREIEVPTSAFNKHYDSISHTSKAFYLSIAALGLFLLFLSFSQTSSFLQIYHFGRLSGYYNFACFTVIIAALFVVAR